MTSDLELIEELERNVPDEDYEGVSSVQTFCKLMEANITDEVDAENAYSKTKMVAPNDTIKTMMESIEENEHTHEKVDRAVHKKFC